MTTDFGDPGESFRGDAIGRTGSGELRAGQRVRIQCGSLLGSRGTIVACRDPGRLLVAPEFSPRGVYLLIDAAFVEQA